MLFSKINFDDLLITETFLQDSCAKLFVSALNAEADSAASNRSKFLQDGDGRWTDMGKKLER